MKRLVIGDIHGCFYELQDLLEKAGIGDDDEIIALGDIVDRGPESPKVLDFFTNTHNARSLMGNHERKHIRSYHNLVRPALSQVITRHQIGETNYADACVAMDQFPRCLELAEADLVHGFFEPGFTLAEQKESFLVGTLSAEMRLRQRYNQPWYELYAPSKPLIVGHLDYLQNGQPLIYNDKVFGLDTGCSHGGRLTGLVLPDFQILSVSSRGNYWNELKEQSYDIRYAMSPVDQLSWEVAERIASQKIAPDDPIEKIQRKKEVQELLQDAEQAINDLYRSVSKRHEEIMNQIALQVDLKSLSLNELGSRYAAQIGKSPLVGFLHKMRHGKLQIATLKQHFKKPAEIIQYVAHNQKEL